jgi:hypothetical protein
LVNISFFFKIKFWCSINNTFVCFFIADSWPKAFDDQNARKDWKWNPRIATLKQLVEKMFTELKKQKNI